MGLTAKQKAPYLLGDSPKEPAQGFLGYFHNTDPTVLPYNALTFPSINCFIPNKDKIVPRDGSTLRGQAHTTGKVWPIIGNQKRFTTMGGITTEVRVAQSDDNNLKDIIEVLYPNPLTGEDTWYQITQNVNPFAKALGKLGMRAKYYMAAWFDTNLTPSISLNLPRLIIVNGSTTVLNWTGGIAPIVSISPGVSITTTSGVTWASLGFVDPALGGSGNIIINGVVYAVSGGWATSTLLIADTTGITVGDVALAQLQSDTAPIQFDSCTQNKNYMYYGNWASRRYFQSNGFNHISTIEITRAQAIQNDLVVGTSPYTGTGSHVYRVTIDSTAPTQSFEGLGSNSLIFDFSGYTLVGNTHTYKVSIHQQINNDGTQGTFFYTVSKDGIQQIAGGPFQGPLGVGPVTSGPYVMVDGITFYIPESVVGTLLPSGASPSYTGYTGALVNGDTYTITITNIIDTFQWQIDGGIPVATLVPITGGLQTLSLGVQISFVSKTGHTLGDYWDLTVNQSITKGWNNFYYTTPERKPGEGYIYNLPANFWTHGVQEENVYVNTAYGYWDYVETTLAANLLSETIRLVPLKQTASAKVIFPYMIGYLENDLSFITENKQLQLIGRKQLIELPQIGYLSQPVDADFQAASFVNGSIEFLNKKEYISSPNESTLLVYDDQSGNKYWQPPQIIPDLGILSIIGNTLISHSSLRNQTMNLFTGQKGDDGSAYTVRARTAYNSFGNRWGKKNSNKSFIEGYMSGKPPLIARVYPVINGGGLQHFVKPVFDPIVNKASFGEGSFGSHSFGSDQFNPHPHFNEIFTEYRPILSYYFIALEAECTTKTHTYSILSMGVNGAISAKGNNQFINQAEISRE